MKKKLLGIVGVVLLVALFAAVAMVCVACDEKPADEDHEKPVEEHYDKTIVFLGDSIAEALIGPSPLGERDNYGYYAVLGKTNNWRYFNHSVSGHKTSGIKDGGNGLLEMLMREDENATLMKTHLQQADVIDISVLGNNILQYNLGLLMLEIADPEFETKLEAGTTLINALEKGEVMTRQSVEVPGETVTFNFPPTYQDLCDIIDRIKELNPDATILFQTVYNPFFENCSHLHAPVIAALNKITDDGRFGKQGQPINSLEQYRAIAQKLLEYLNNFLYKYLDEHNGDEFVILDVNKRFDEIAKSDTLEDGSVNYTEDSLGRYLIYDDWTHPSNFGHAVIADVTEEALVKLGLADEASAVANYKSLRVEQLNRLYKNVKGFDLADAVNAVNNATTYSDVTMAYFLAIRGYTPIY